MQFTRPRVTKVRRKFLCLARSVGYRHGNQAGSVLQKSQNTFHWSVFCLIQINEWRPYQPWNIDRGHADISSTPHDCSGARRGITAQCMQSPDRVERSAGRQIWRLHYGFLLFDQAGGPHTFSDAADSRCMNTSPACTAPTRNLGSLFLCHTALLSAFQLHEPLSL